MAAKVNAALVGSGNIGTDLLYKALPQRVDPIRSGWSASMPTSEGLATAREMGLKTTADGVDGLLPHVAADDVQHRLRCDLGLRARRERAQAPGARRGGDRPHARGDRPVLRAAGQPARARRQARDERQHGDLRRPGDDPDGRGGQPRAAGRLRRDRRHRRVEVGRARARARTSTSSPARPRSGIEKVGGAKRGKAIIILNPAEPPLIMRDTIHCLTDGEPDAASDHRARCTRWSREVQKYVPGYRLKNGPVFDGKRVSDLSSRSRGSATTCRSTPATSTS